MVPIKVTAVKKSWIMTAAFFFLLMSGACGCAGLRELMDRASAGMEAERDRAAGERARYLDDNPGLSVRVREAVRRGELAEGMTRRDAMAAMGPPARSSAEWIGGHEIARDEFRSEPGIPPDVCAVFTDGRLTGK
jgi:hypothetical protein